MDDDFSFLYSTTGQDEDEEAKAGGGWLVMISEADFVHQDPKNNFRKPGQEPYLSDKPHFQ